MKYIFIILSLLACSETTIRSTEEDTDYQDCDYACEFAELSYYCHKDVMELDLKYVPDYENDFKNQDDECIDIMIEIVYNQDEYDDLTLCSKWLSDIKGYCKFGI